MSPPRQAPPQPASGDVPTPRADRMVTVLGITLALLGLLGGVWAALVGIVPGGFADSDRIFLVDARGEVREAFNGLKPGTPQEVVAAIANLRGTKTRP